MNAPDLAARFGLHRSGREWRGSCPACGYGSDAFSVSTGRAGRPLAWCASCRDKDAIAAALGHAGAPVAPSATHAASEATKATEARAKAQERARRLWDGADPITADDPAGRYLARRHLPHLIGSAALRFRADTPHPAGGRLPAMIALVQNVEGAPLGIHRTYLRPDGTKAVVEVVKASLGPVFGGAIRLAPAGDAVLIGEGIETAAAAGLIFSMPAWAAVSAGNLKTTLPLPPEIRSVMIAADPDQPGIEAAEHAARRWKAEGRAVRIMKPEMRGRDFADLLKYRMEAA